MRSRKVLFVTLSNIGDVILTLPAFDRLLEAFPDAEVSVVSPPSAAKIFEAYPRCSRVFTFKKPCSLSEKISLCRRLSSERFDRVIDLKNSFIGAALAPGRALFFPALKLNGHMSERHVEMAERITGVRMDKPVPSSMVIPELEKEFAPLLANKGHGNPCIVIAPGAKSDAKRWPEDNFREVIARLHARLPDARIVLAGDERDRELCSSISREWEPSVMNAAGRTSIVQLMALIQRAALVITNDSAPLHIAGYLGKPSVAVFGPTDERRYGPWPGTRAAVMKREIACRPCMRAQCPSSDYRCLALVKPREVADAAVSLLLGEVPPEKPSFSRILVSRTDRIGDVILSSPVFCALRKAFPSAYIAAMVRPYTRHAVEGNPFVDEVILYDKDRKEKSWPATLAFAASLRKKRFDLALLLHPTARTNLISFLAGIPRRVGFGQKLGFLLTDRARNTKHEGRKHESEYTMELLTMIGLKPAAPELFFPLKQESERWAREFLERSGIDEGKPLAIFHPGASCPSKIWPPERYAETADALVKKGFAVIVMSGPDSLDRSTGEAVLARMKEKAFELCGKADISQTASLVRLCSVFISSDTGPMHVASALDVPQVAIFGRNQPGLHPRRWGPRSRFHRVVHKDVGCARCSAHACGNGFACLNAIGVDEVLEAIAQVVREAGKR